MLPKPIRSDPWQQNQSNLWAATDVPQNKNKQNKEFNGPYFIIVHKDSKIQKNLLTEIYGSVFF